MRAAFSTFRLGSPLHGGQRPECGVLNPQPPCRKSPQVIFPHPFQFGFQALAVLVPSGVHAGVVTVMKPGCAPPFVPKAFQAQLLQAILCVLKREGSCGSFVAALCPFPPVERDARQNLLAGDSLILNVSISSKLSMRERRYLPVPAPTLCPTIGDAKCLPAPPLTE